MASTNGGKVSPWACGETTSADARTDEKAPPTAVDQRITSNIERSFGASPTHKASSRTSPFVQTTPEAPLLWRDRVPSSESQTLLNDAQVAPLTGGDVMLNRFQIFIGIQAHSSPSNGWLRFICVRSRNTVREPTGSCMRLSPRPTNNGRCPRWMPNDSSVSTAHRRTQSEKTPTIGNRSDVPVAKPRVCHEIPDDEVRAGRKMFFSSVIVPSMSMPPRLASTPQATSPLREPRTKSA